MASLDQQREATRAGVKGIPMRPLTTAELGAVYHAAGFRGPALAEMVATSLAESGGQWWAHNNQGEDSRGISQINVGPGANTQFRSWDLFDPVQNARAAFEVYRRNGNTFLPWAGYTSGNYQQFLPDAYRATRQIMPPDTGSMGMAGQPGQGLPPVNRQEADFPRPGAGGGGVGAPAPPGVDFSGGLGAAQQQAQQYGEMPPGGYQLVPPNPGYTGPPQNLGGGIILDPRTGIAYETGGADGGGSSLEDRMALSAWENQLPPTAYQQAGLGAEYGRLGLSRDQFGLDQQQFGLEQEKFGETQEQNEFGRYLDMIEQNRLAQQLADLERQQARSTLLEAGPRLTGGRTTFGGYGAGGPMDAVARFGGFTHSGGSTAGAQVPLDVNPGPANIDPQTLALIERYVNS